MLLNIISILGALIPTILLNRGAIGADTDNLIMALISPITKLIASLQAGQTASDDGLAALIALQNVIVVLKANTSLDPDTLTSIEGVDADVQAALAAYNKAGEGLDLRVYAPIAEV